MSGFKTLVSLLGLVLLVAFLLPPMIKLKELSLSLVILIGVAMAAYEFYEAMTNKDA